MSNPLVTFVACAHNERYNRPFHHCMLNQTCKDYKAIIWHNGPYYEGGFPDGTWNVSNTIQFRQSPIDTGNYGCANRQQAIDECTTDYIIQTSVQDVWMYQAVEFILKGLQDAPDILIWNSVNHLVGPCKVLDAQLAWSKLDWGNFAIRTDIAKQIPIRQTEYCADWLFVNDCIQKGLIKTAKKLNNILTIHNAILLLLATTIMGIIVL